MVSHGGFADVVTPPPRFHPTPPHRIAHSKRRLEAETETGEKRKEETFKRRQAAFRHRALAAGGRSNDVRSPERRGRRGDSQRGGQKRLPEIVVVVVDVARGSDEEGALPGASAFGVGVGDGGGGDGDGGVAQRESADRRWGGAAPRPEG